MMNLTPCPSSRFSPTIVPPCWCTMFRAMNRPKTGAAELGREVRCEDPRQVLCSDGRPIIGEAYDDTLRIRGRRDLDVPRLLHGLNCVDQHVEEHVDQLVRHCHDGLRARQVQAHLNAGLLHPLSHQEQRLLDKLVHLHRLVGQLGRPVEVQDAVGDLTQAHDLLAGHAETFGSLPALEREICSHFDVTAQRLQGVVDLVRQRGSQPAQSGAPLGLDQLCL